MINDQVIISTWFQHHKIYFIHRRGDGIYKLSKYDVYRGLFPVADEYVDIYYQR